MLTASSGKCMTCGLEDVFFVDTQDPQRPFWYTECCGPQPEYDKSLPSAGEAEANNLLREEAMIALKAGKTIKSRSNPTWESNFYNGYLGGHVVREVHPNQDRVVHSEGERQRLLEKNGINPDNPTEFITDDGMPL